MNNNPELISTTNNSSIYLVKVGTYYFYISVPKSKDVAIVLNLIDDPNSINGEKVSEDERKRKVNEIYGTFTQENLVVVTPVIPTETMNQFKGTTVDMIKEGTPLYTTFTGPVMNEINNIVNRACGLIYKNKNISPTLIINYNPSYKSLFEYYAQDEKKKDRIKFVQFNAQTYSMGNKASAVQAPSFTPKEEPINTVAPTPNINAATLAGASAQALNTMPLAGDASIPVAGAINAATLDAAQVATPIEKANQKRLVRTKDQRGGPGFISYVLLGVIVAILSLIGLYLLL